MDRDGGKGNALKGQWNKIIYRSGWRDGPVWLLELLVVPISLRQQALALGVHHHLRLHHLHYKLSVIRTWDLCFSRLVRHYHSASKQQQQI